LKRFLFLLIGVTFAALAACSAGDARTFGSPETPGSADAGLALPEDPTDWSYVYARYFGEGTPGHCGNAGCHDEKRKGFSCGATKDSCYEGLVGAGLVDTKNPLASVLGDPKRSPLAWFGEGLEPFDDPSPNAEAAQAITRWLEAGAKNRGWSSPYKTPLDGGEDARTPPPDAGRDSAAVDSAADAGRRDAGAIDANVPAPTWTYLYAYYFGASTPGHCGDCHHSTYNGFRCGSSKYSCYVGMIDAGLIDQQNPSASVLGDPARSPLSWFGGDMPSDAPNANPQAAGLVKSWLNAGAPYN
jgi:hypothetical protein